MAEGATAPTVGLSVIRARAAPIAVIFRQGPTKQVRMVRWRMDTDELLHGQWFAGRLFPARCDISPDGELVVYFARRRSDTFTAVARPPYFTPLAVWDEEGEWNGGGEWLSNVRLRLRSRMPLEPGFTLPSWLELRNQLDASRFNRDGWQRVDAEAVPYTGGKRHATLAGIELQRRPARSVDGKITDRHAYAFRIVTPAGPRDDLGTADWADWHPSGDVAIARDGVIQRIAISHRCLGEATTVVDFNGDTFEKLAPPAWALAWPAR
jgi:hypothetical protein